MESLKKGETVIPTPRWFIFIRAAQILFALIIIALAGYFIHGAYYDSLGVAIAAGVFTWIVAAYAILTERSAACRSGYNTWAILSLDFFLAVFWLASLGSNAQFAASFDTIVNTSNCYNDGSAINSNHCTITKRGYVAGPAALGALSGVAGLSALMLIFFLITFAYVAHFFRLEWAKHSGDVEKGSGYAAPAATGPMDQPQPFVNQQQQQQQQQQPQWSQQQYQANAYPASSPAYDPYTAPQNTGYAGAQGVYNQTAPQQAPSELHSAQSTPAPGQPYYPPH